MEIETKLKCARVSAKKLRDVSRALLGRRATDELSFLKFSTRNSARLTFKTLSSAIAIMGLFKRKNLTISPVWNFQTKADINSLNFVSETCLHDYNFPRPFIPIGLQWIAAFISRQAKTFGPKFPEAVFQMR
jgi:hypothetical protein